MLPTQGKAKRDVELAPIKASRNTFQDDTRPKTGARSQPRALGDERARARAQRPLTRARTHTRTHTGARTFLRACNRRTNARTNACSNLRGGRKARARTHTVGQQMGAGARGLGRIECLVVTRLPAPGLDRSSCGDAGRRLRLLLLRLLRGWLHGLLHLHLPAHRCCRRKRLRYDRRRHHRQVQRLGRLGRLLLFLLQARDPYAGRTTASEGLFMPTGPPSDSNHKHRHTMWSVGRSSVAARKAAWSYAMRRRRAYPLQPVDK